MKLYAYKTREATGAFLRGNRSFPECIVSLDAALADLIPRLKGDQLRALMLANNEIVTEEMEKRGLQSKRAASPERLFWELLRHRVAQMSAARQGVKRA
jgi:hypothetical protein